MDTESYVLMDTEIMDAESYMMIRKIFVANFKITRSENFSKFHLEFCKIFNRLEQYFTLDRIS